MRSEAIVADVESWATEARDSPEAAIAVFENVHQARDAADHLWASGKWSQFWRSAGSLKLKNERGDQVRFFTYRMNGHRGHAADRLFIGSECPVGMEAAFLPCLARRVAETGK